MWRWRCAPRRQQRARTHVHVHAPKPKRAHARTRARTHAHSERARAQAHERGPQRMGESARERERMYAPRTCSRTMAAICGGIASSPGSGRCPGHILRASCRDIDPLLQTGTENDNRLFGQQQGIRSRPVHDLTKGRGQGWSRGEERGGGGWRRWWRPRRVRRCCWWAGAG